MGFELYGHKANEYNPKLKMGCLIGCVAEDQINYKGGTLGAFIDLPDGNVGCITSAHVVFNNTGMANLICKKAIDTRDNSGKILQPVPFHGPHFGRVTRAAYNDGSNGEIGVEAAFILIEDPARIPESGEFPEGDFRDIGFSPGNPISYTSGMIYTSVPDETRLSTVYKYGSETLLTRGAFHLHGPSIRTGSVVSSLDNFGFCLQNQIQMVKVGENDFAKNGDSGALVLVPHKADINDLRAIGILTGGSTDGTLYYVTPIWAVLRALGFNDSIKLKCFDDVGPCAMDTDETTQTVEDQLKNIHLYGQSVTDEEENHSTTINISKQLETHTNQLREEINDFKEEIKSEQSAVTEQLAEFKSDITNQLTQTKTEMQDVVQKTIDDKLDTFLEKLNKHLP